jgi:hypothetical protein
MNDMLDAETTVKPAAGAGAAGATGNESRPPRALEPLEPPAWMSYSTTVSRSRALS